MNVFVSDIHLGIKDCEAEKLDNFLKKNKPNRLYLVGDIIDLWRLRSKSFWPQSHVDLVRRILSLAKKGTTVYWIIGNHDLHFLSYLDRNMYFEFGNIHLTRVTSYKNYLVIHGDQFDTWQKYGWVGDKLYALVSLFTKKSGQIRNDVKKYVIEKMNFERRAIRVAETGRYNGIICGHTHTPMITDKYINCGDMIESYSLVIDHNEGNEFIPELIFLK